LENRIGLTISDKDFNTVISRALEISWTRDPFDRIVVANASLDDSILISKDQTIRDNYPSAIW
jgi:PIN domain nuclease of toxin-antitoxin system